MSDQPKSQIDKEGFNKNNSLKNRQVYQVAFNQAGSHLTEQVPYYKSTHSQYIQKVEDQKKFSIKFTQFLRSKTAYILLSLCFNGLAVILFITNSYLVSYETEGAPLFHMALKFLLLTFFTLEYMEHLINSSNKLQEFQKFSMVLDLITIIIVTHDLYGNFTNKNNLLEDKLLWTLLCLKFLKVKQILQSLVFKTHIQPNPDKLPPILPQDQQLRQATLATVLNIFALCLINTSVILFVDEAAGGSLLTPYQNKKLQFHSALYFQIITMTTIGYGDVTPIQTSGRVITTIFILICAVLFTKWLGKILSLVSKQDKTKSKFKKQAIDNIIIIGNMFKNTSHIEKFLKNHYSVKYAEKASKFTKQLVFVTSTPPKHDPNAYIKFEGLRISYKIHKVKYVIINSFENDLSWIKKAGLNKASALMCFNYEDNQSDAYNSERNIIFSLGLITRKFPNLKIFVYFTTDLILNETKLLDLSKNFSQRINCRKKYMNYCLTSSIENDGVGALLQMLLLNKDKINQFSINFFNDMMDDQEVQPTIKHLLKDYYQGSKNQIYCYEFPQFLIGESFVNAAKFLYLYSYNHVQPQDQSSNEHADNEIRIILIGVKSKSQKKVYPNPGHYRIKDGDKALFIAENEASFKFFQNLTVESKQFFDKNFEQPSLSLQLTNDILNEMVAASLYTARYCEVEYDTMNINLFNNPRMLDVSNHIILVGVQEEDIIDIFFNIRRSNQNRVLVFIQDEPFHSMPIRLKEQKNLFFVQCSLKDSSHLGMLKINQSEKIVIRFVKDLQHIQDIKLFKFYRLILEFYPKSKVLLTLNDEKYLDFLDKRPFQQKLTWMYWPQVMTGNVILEPILFHSVNALMYYEKAVSSLIMQIASISIRTQNTYPLESQIFQQNPEFMNQKQQEQAQQPSQSFLGGNEKFKGGLYTFTITKRCANQIKQFGDLQYHFLNRKAPFVLLALLKKAQKIEKPGLQQMYDQQDEEDYEDVISEQKDQQKQKLDQNKHHIISNYNNSKIKGNLLQEQVDLLKFNTDSILVNPPPYNTQLNEGDKVIVLGIIDGIEETKMDKNTLNFLNVEEEQKEDNKVQLTNKSLQEIKQQKQLVDEYKPELFQQQLALTKDLITIYESYNQMLQTIINS